MNEKTGKLIWLACMAAVWAIVLYQCAAQL